MAEQGNPASISDVGVGLLATRAGISGAALNVRINLPGLKDAKVTSALAQRIDEITRTSESEFGRIFPAIESKMA
jgi:glutamate formiminotransferase/formiminotetrahydrofolate cyclodeaminase